MDWGELGDDGSYTCEFCGKKCELTIGPSGHYCKQMIDAHAKRMKEWEKDYKGRGMRKGKLVIEYECFDSDMAFQSLLDAVSLDTDYNDGEGEDDTLNCKWKVTHSKEKIKK